MALDGIHEVGADIWVDTAEQFGDGSVHDATPVWRKVANAKKPRATLIGMDAMIGDADTRSSTTPSDVASAAGAALLGFLAGRIRRRPLAARQT